jgi:thioredoxin reductase
LRVLVVDEGISPGGQLVKQTHKFFGSENFYASTRGMEIAVKLLKELSLYSRATIASESSVLAIYPDGVPVLDRRSDSTTLYNPARLLVATGASERFLQFDNNDLPGVYGAGAVQTLMNQFGILPGKSVLMIGSGNIGLIVSYQLAQAGVEVKAILEASSRIGGYRVHADKVKRLGIPVLLNHTILKAIGEESVKGALITALDDRWKPVPGTERELVIDTICIAVGLTPSAELVAQAGGQLKYIPELGGYVPLHDGDMRTTIDRVFVAGDVSVIEEETTAMIEGRIAGLNIVKDIKGECDETRLTDLKETLNRFRCGPTSSKIRSGLEKMNLATRAARYTVQPLRNELPGRSDKDRSEYKRCACDRLFEMYGLWCLRYQVPGSCHIHVSGEGGWNGSGGNPLRISSRSRERPDGLRNRKKRRSALHGKGRSYHQIGKQNEHSLSDRSRRAGQRCSPHTRNEQRRKLTGLSLRRDNG